MAKPEPWVSIDEIASRLGVAKDSVYRWIEGRHLPAHRLGRLWKFKISEVDAWLRSGGAEPAEAPTHGGQTEHKTRSSSGDRL